MVVQQTYLDLGKIVDEVAPSYVGWRLGNGVCTMKISKAIARIFKVRTPFPNRPDIVESANGNPRREIYMLI